MNIIVKFIGDFIFSFAVLFLISFFINKKKKKKGFSKLKSTDQVLIFIKRYNLNVELLGFQRILFNLSLINAIIISFTSSIIINIDSYLWSIVIAFVLIMVLIYSLYELAGRRLKNMENKLKGSGRNV